MDDLLRMSRAYRAEVQEESAPSPVQHLRVRLQHALHKEYDTRWRPQLTEPRACVLMAHSRRRAHAGEGATLIW